MSAETGFRQVHAVLAEIQNELAELAPCDVAVFIAYDGLRVVVHWAYQERDLYFSMDVDLMMPAEMVVGPARRDFNKQLESLKNSQNVLSHDSYIDVQVRSLIDCAREVGRLATSELTPMERTEAIEVLATTFLPEVVKRCGSDGYPNDDVDHILSIVHHALYRELEQAQR